MATVTLEAHVDADPAHVWSKVRDITWPGALTEMITSVVPTGEMTRDCTMADGGHLEETILSVDDEARRVAYTITESPFGFTHHNAALQAFPDAQGTRLVWTIDLLPDALADVLGPVLGGEIKTMATRLSASA